MKYFVVALLAIGVLVGASSAKSEDLDLAGFDIGDYYADYDIQQCWVPDEGDFGWTYEWSSDDLYE